MKTIYMPQTINYMLSLGMNNEVNELFAAGELKTTESNAQYLLITKNN
jgi:hypothetical protein